MAHELWQAFVQVSGSVNAVLLGLILIFSPRLRRTRGGQKLGLALLAYGYLLLSFTLVDNVWLAPQAWLLLSDFVIVLLASALFCDYVATSMKGAPLSARLYLPPLAFLAAAILAGPEFTRGNAIEWVVMIQIGYTLLTTWIYLTARPGLARCPRHLTALLAGLWVLHSFQFSRVLMPDVGWLFDAVPLVGAALILFFTVFVLTDPRSLKTLAPRELPGVPGITVETIDQFLHTEQPHLDPGLSLDQLASALGVSSRELSAALATSADGCFYHLINRHRVEEARRILVDPVEQRTSIEAVGLMAGFRARSTFYEAFRRQTGQTPAAYRKTHG